MKLLSRNSVTGLGRVGKQSAALLSLVTLPIALQATAILSDSFAYPDGPITNATGSPWVGHNGSGTNNEALVISGKLQLTFARTEDVSALLAGQPYTTGGGAVLYTGFSVNFSALPTQAGSYFAHFKDNSTGYRARVWASTSNAPSGSFRLGIGNSSGASASSGQLTSNLTLNTTYSFVTRYNVASGLSTIWLNPSAESNPSVTATDAPGPITITSYAFRQNTGMGTLLVDDLRVGTSFADVISNAPPAPTNAAAFSILTYNTHGNMVEDWSTNSPQVQAIGRQMSYLNPDVITFQEIPFTNTCQMVNFVLAYLPGYFLATNSGTDGYVRGVIASRFPITRSTKWLDGVSLVPFGYTNSPSTFTRDLFEAQISVPNFPQPLHVFTTHLKSGTDADSAARRAAEASALSNYFVTGFLTTNASRPYVLTGDLNEDINRPSSTNEPIQRLANAATGLELTTPRNPVNNDDRTISIRTSLYARYDYVLPCALLFSNISSSQVFRTDRLTNPPPPLLTNDDITASDHLPVLMVFSNPFDTPFRLLSIGVSNQLVTLKWESAPGRQYRVEASPNLTAWSDLVTNLAAAGTNLTFTTNTAAAWQFYRVYRWP